MRRHFAPKERVSMTPKSFEKGPATAITQFVPANGRRADKCKLGASMGCAHSAEGLVASRTGSGHSFGAVANPNPQRKREIRRLRQGEESASSKRSPEALDNSLVGDAKSPPTAKGQRAEPVNGISPKSTASTEPSPVLSTSRRRSVQAAVADTLHALSPRRLSPASATAAWPMQPGVAVTFGSWVGLGFGLGAARVPGFQALAFDPDPSALSQGNFHTHGKLPRGGSKVALESLLHHLATPLPPTPASTAGHRTPTGAGVSSAFSAATA
ncbi:unnamed protein product, partial [Phaeothamnion confervicola]